MDMDAFHKESYVILNPFRFNSFDAPAEQPDQPAHAFVLPARCWPKPHIVSWE